MTANELADKVTRTNDVITMEYDRILELDEAAQMLRQQAQEIERLNFVLKNLVLATNKKIDELEEALEDCTCQGSHSEAYLKASELTDKEITQCLNESIETKNVWGQPMTELNPIEFARSILKKARKQ